MEKPINEDENLKYSILSRINELLDCVQTLGKTNFFEITVKHKNGELVTEASFSQSNIINKELSKG